MPSSGVDFNSASSAALKISTVASAPNSPAFTLVSISFL